MIRAINARTLVKAAMVRGKHGQGDPCAVDRSIALRVTRDDAPPQQPRRNCSP